MKTFKSFLMCVVLLFCVMHVSTAYAGCTCRATSLESTQLKNKLELVKQLQEQVRMVKAQLQMIERLGGQLSSKLNGANSMILGQFDKLIKTWKDSMSLTHAMDDFEEQHRRRHPDYDPNGEITYETASNKRDEEFRKMLEGYLKGVNLTALDLEDANRARQQMYEVLQSAEGQVQALQALGGMINHSSTILERNGQLAATQITMFAENERDRRDKEQDLDKNYDAAFDGMTEVKNEHPGHKIDIKSTW